jgi:hypothetical protein
MTETAQLPTIVRTYLTAHREHDNTTAIAAFAADATVIDEGHTYLGLEEIRDWLQQSAGEYTYTIELTGADRLGEDHWVAIQHLEGNFPGGVVDLRFEFSIAGDKIRRLVIAP